MPADGHFPWQEISRLGKKLIQAGLTSSRFGNISLLDGDKILITCTGSMLDELDESQIVRVDLASVAERVSSMTTPVLLTNGKSFTMSPIDPEATGVIPVVTVTPR